MRNFSDVEKLDLAGKRVVVSGGTQGIGAGIARLAARLGAAVAIIGRNAALGKNVISSLAIRDTASKKNHVFISADLSTIAGAKEVSQKLKDWAGEDNIDLLFQTQGGPPSATEIITSDKLELHFALQALSRFILTYQLVQLGALRDATVLLIASAGQAGDAIDFDNIDAKGGGMWLKVLSTSAVIDAYTKEFNNRYPSLRVLHSFPGMVRTNVMSNSGAPWYFNLMASIVFTIPFMSVSTDDAAKTAIWLTTSKKVKENRDVCAWTQYATEARLSTVAKDDALRVKVWETMVSLTEGTATS